MRSPAAAALALASVPVVCVCCGGTGREASTVGLGAGGEDSPSPRALRGRGLRASGELGLRGLEGAHLLPRSTQQGKEHGVDAGGGTRLLVEGLRVLAFPGGAMRAAADWFPGDPSVVPIPNRLGGGFLYALDRRLWSSDSWLGHATPVFLSPSTVDRVVVGLDRVYLHSPQGALMAVLPPTLGSGGAWTPSGDLGPLPPGPNGGHIAALDGWNAAALGDLQGLLVTSNAGETWQRVPIGVAPIEVRVRDGTLLVGGLHEEQRPQWWKVTGGVAIPVPLTATTAAAEAPRPRAAPLGEVPLETAVEDGVPLDDGTALVLRDGAMGRVRLTDGAVVETALDAYPLPHSRCHPLALSSRADPGAFGFVCGEPRGQTLVLRWDSGGGRPVVLRRFAAPREVLAFDNGALAIRGSCAETAGVGSAAAEQTYCVLPAGGAWRELRFRGDDGEQARLVVLGDGRAVVLHPPIGGDLSSASLAFFDRSPEGSGRAESVTSRAAEVKLTMPVLREPESRVLRDGIWRDGFEERRPGVLSGWVESADSVLGVEVSFDGQLKVGQHMQEAILPVVAGRWGLGWTASKRGFETTDGGMTWHAAAVPDPLTRSGEKVACGPLGCESSGWLRVGWGASEMHATEDPMPAPRTPGWMPPPLALECEPRTLPAPPEPSTPQTLAVAMLLRPSPIWTAPSAAASNALPPLATRNAPVLTAADSGVSAEASVGLDRTAHAMGLARIYAWGPKSGDWDEGARWQVLWQWPWGAWPEVRSTAETHVKWTTIDAARLALGGAGMPVEWSLTPDDEDHALLAGRRRYGPSHIQIVVLDANRAPIEVGRDGNEPVADLEGALRLGGRWYIATSQGSGELCALVLWRIEGSLLREVARLPRLGVEPRAPFRLAQGEDGRTVGVLMDGPPSSDGAPVVRWAFPVDIETGAVGSPERLGASDLSDRPVLLCNGDELGWRVELPYPGSVSVRAGAYRARLQSPFVRMRVGRDSACLERALGAIEPLASRPPEALTSHLPDRLARAKRTIQLSVLSARMRYLLECTAR